MSSTDVNLTEIESVFTKHLSELAVSVQFDPPAGFDQAHLGSFWKSVCEPQGLKKVITTSRISPIVESPKNSKWWIPSRLQFGVEQTPELRIQYANNSIQNDEWLWQTQVDRFVINWRKKEIPFPGITKILGKFISSWNNWNSFIKKEFDEDLKFNAWDMVFINTIPEEEFLNESASTWAVFSKKIIGNFLTKGDSPQLCSVLGRWAWNTNNPNLEFIIELKPGNIESMGNVFFCNYTIRQTSIPENGNLTSQQLESCQSIGFNKFMNLLDSLNKQ